MAGWVWKGSIASKVVDKYVPFLISEQRRKREVERSRER